eukprot:360244-Chlamydomonas_euryale.AAC.5
MQKRLGEWAVADLRNGRQKQPTAAADPSRSRQATLRPAHCAPAAKDSYQRCSSAATDTAHLPPSTRPIGSHRCNALEAIDAAHRPPLTLPTGSHRRRPSAAIDAAHWQPSTQPIGCHRRRPLAAIDAAHRQPSTQPIGIHRRRPSVSKDSQQTLLIGSPGGAFPRGRPSTFSRPIGLFADGRPSDPCPLQREGPVHLQPRRGRRAIEAAAPSPPNLARRVARNEHELCAAARGRAGVDGLHKCACGAQACTRSAEAHARGAHACMQCPDVPMRACGAHARMRCPCVHAVPMRACGAHAHMRCPCGHAVPMRACGAHRACGANARVRCPCAGMPHPQVWMRTPHARPQSPPATTLTAGTAARSLARRNGRLRLANAVQATAVKRGQGIGSVISDARERSPAAGSRGPVAYISRKGQQSGLALNSRCTWGSGWLQHRGRAVESQHFGRAVESYCGYCTCLLQRIVLGRIVAAACACCSALASNLDAVQKHCKGCWKAIGGAKRRLGCRAAVEIRHLLLHDSWQQVCPTIGQQVGASRFPSFYAPSPTHTAPHNCFPACACFPAHDCFTAASMTHLLHKAPVAHRCLKPYSTSCPHTLQPPYRAMSAACPHSVAFHTPHPWISPAAIR